MKQESQNDKEKPTIEDMKKDLKFMGILFWFVGATQIWLAFVNISEADIVIAIWCGLFVLVGMLNLKVQVRCIFILNGLVLFLVGAVILLLLSGVFWVIIALFQFYIGTMEFVKYRKYANVE